MFAHYQQSLSRPNFRNSKSIKIQKLWLKWQHLDVQCQYNFIYTQYSAFLHHPSKLQVTNIVVLASIVKITSHFLFPTGPIVREKLRIWAETFYLSPMNIIQGNFQIHKYCWIKTDQLDATRFIYFTTYCSTCFEC